MSSVKDSRWPQYLAPAVCYGSRVPLDLKDWEQKSSMAEDLSQVRGEHKFDEASLHEYLKKQLVGFPRGDGRLTVLQYRFVFDLFTCEHG